jgi:hypothetical protein
MSVNPPPSNVADRIPRLSMPSSADIKPLLDPSSIHVKANIYAGYPIQPSVDEMNQHYHSPTSTFGYSDFDQVFQDSTEEKAVAARRKNAEAQKMYRIRKKEHEQSLEREGVYPIVFRFLWV